MITITSAITNEASLPMNPDEPTPRYPRNKDELLRDFTVARKIRDIHDSAKLQDHLAPKWWEAVIGLVQFAAALGLLAAIVQHPALKEDLFGRLIAFWVALMILSLVLGFEFVIFRLHHLRRANVMALRRIEELERRLREIEEAKKYPDVPPQS